MEWLLIECPKMPRRRPTIGWRKANTPPEKACVSKATQIELLSIEHVTREELRERLELQPEWIKGEHKQRFGKSWPTGGRTCWALAVTENSPVGLVRLIERIEGTKWP